MTKSELSWDSILVQHSKINDHINRLKKNYVIISRDAVKSPPPSRNGLISHSKLRPHGKHGLLVR